MRPELIGSFALLAGTLWVAGWEIYGAVKNKATITGDWTFVDVWLKHHNKYADVFWRMGTLGLLAWAMFHLWGQK